MMALVTRFRHKRLVGLLFELALADVALVGEEDEAPQSVQFFALVELAVYALPEVYVLGVAKQKDGFLQAAILLQGAGQGVLARFGLQPAH
jgi:hypothetical protein